MSRFNKLLLAIVMLGSNFNISFTQSIFRWQVPVTDFQEHLLVNPLGGGLNSPQFSSIDLNGDELSDIYVFDRSGGISLTFVADTSIPSGYRHVPEFENIFPVLQDWVLLRDFNQDSLADIFTYSSTGVPGIDVYRAQRIDGQLTYVKMIFNNPVRVLGYPTSSGTVTNIYVAGTDIPAIDDIDGDGDLDILTFQSDGTKLYYYRNLAREKQLPADTFDFILEDKCWGRFIESFNTNDVILSSDSLLCPNSVQNARLHSGSTVTTFDHDDDGDKDVLLGDLTYSTMLYLENGGSAATGWIVNQTSNFPDPNQRIEIPYFPGAYILDINHDGVNDLVASPNEKDSRENVQLAWYYQGATEGLSYSLHSKALLNDEMLDFGTEANPLLLDYNGDGLTDLIVGSRFNENYQAQFPSQLFLLENTGTASQPAFKIVDEDWLNLSTFIDEVDALFPSAVDIDNDKDLDLVIGNKFGKLIFIENIGIENGPFQMGEIIYPWFDIDVGFSSAPAFVDLDADGIFDMIIGEERGTINFFKNLGTARTPLFLADIESPENYVEFGAIDARQNNAVFGMSAPTIFHSQDTTLLLVGTNFGNLLLYDITNVQPTDVLQPMSDHPITKIRDGARSKPVLGDLDADGYLDMVLGTSRGGINLYRTPFGINQMVPTLEFASPDFISIYPNPAQHQLYIRSKSSLIKQVKLINTTGVAIFEWTGMVRDLELDVDKLPPGLYYATMLTGDGLIIKPWIKM